MKKNILIGLSACLAGEKVRFDGGHRKDHGILEHMGKCFEFRTFCPEIAIGMGVPRQTVRLATSKQGLQAVGIKDPTLNVTSSLKNIAEPQHVWIKNLSGYIVKKGSPSCGMERVKVYSSKLVDPIGRGLYTEEIMKAFPLLPVEEEGRLKDSLLLDSFVQRVYAYNSWNILLDKGLTSFGIINFHTQYKMVLLSRCQKSYQQLGRLISNIPKNNIDAFGEKYIQLCMQTLKKPATRGGHVNVLQHLQGFLKRNLAAGEKQNLTFTVDKYAKGELPLIAPLTLLIMYFQKHKYNFIERSLYLRPYPIELGIYNKM